MELFDLQAKITLDTKGYESDIKNAQKSMKGLADGVDDTGGAVSNFSALTVAKGHIIADAAKKAAEVIIETGKQAVENYANYEQLIGGVETLFGAGGASLEEFAEKSGQTVEQASADYATLMQSQEMVIENAKEAYKTAGMDVNTYMETVTGFSASLLQSLGGDTVKAAEIADVAITDMSDNANKFGTDIGSIQYAYQGFSKQNYTMLKCLAA